MFLIPLEIKYVNAKHEKYIDIKCPGGQYIVTYDLNLIRIMLHTRTFAWLAAFCFEFNLKIVTYSTSVFLILVHKTNTLLWLFNCCTITAPQS